MNLWVLTNPRASRSSHVSLADRSEVAAAREPNRVLVSVGPQRPRRRVPRSKNCANARKQAASDSRRRYKQRQYARQLQAQILEMDQRLALMAERAVVAQQNAQVAAMTVIRTYFEFAARGYDPQGQPERAQRLERFVRSTFAEDLRTNDFTGLAAFFQQWLLVSNCHASFTCRVDGVEIMTSTEISRVRGSTHEMEETHVVKTYGVTALEISRATIESVFPHILANEPLVQSLIGKTYSFAFTLFAYVSARDSRVFQIESKIDLTSALLDLLQDPFATIQMVNNTTMNKRGNLLLRSDVREDQNVIENGFL